MINNTQVPTTSQEYPDTQVFLDAIGKLDQKNLILERENRSLASENTQIKGKVPMLEDAIKTRALSLSLYAELKLHDRNVNLALLKEVNTLKQAALASKEYTEIVTQASKQKVSERKRLAKENKTQASKIEELEQQLSATKEDLAKLTKSNLTTKLNDMEYRSNRDAQLYALIAKIDEEIKEIIASVTPDKKSMVQKQTRLEKACRKLFIAKDKRLKTETKIEMITLHLSDN